MYASIDRRSDRVATTREQTEVKEILAAPENQNSDDLYKSLNQQIRNK
jgi:hypothetical protein